MSIFNLVLLLFVYNSFVLTIILFCNRSSWILCHTTSYKSWRVWHNCWHIWASACSFWLGEFENSVHSSELYPKNINIALDLNKCSQSLWYIVGKVWRSSRPSGGKKCRKHLHNNCRKWKSQFFGKCCRWKRHQHQRVAGSISRRHFGIWSSKWSNAWHTRWKSKVAI